MAVDTQQQYWFLADTTSDARLPFIATPIGSTIGAGAGQDVTTDEYVGPEPVIAMNADAQSKPSRLAQLDAFLYRAISWIPSFRVAQALHGTGQDVSSTSNPTGDSYSPFDITRVTGTITSGVKSVAAVPSKILGSVTAGITKIVILVVVVSFVLIYLASFAQRKGATA